MPDRPPVIDSDGHVQERQSDVRKYLAPPWDKRPSVSGGGGQPWDRELFGTLLYEEYPRGMSPAQQVEVWLKAMDREGMEEAVLFPTGSGSASKIQEPEFAVAVCRAINDHFAKEYNTLSERIHAVGVLPLKQPAEAAKELRRAVTELGLVSFEMVAMGHPVPFGDPIYYPIYEEAERLGVPLCVHPTVGDPGELGGGEFRTFAEVHAYLFPVSLFRHFTSMIFEGVTVRFPNLRLGFLEIGASWLPYWLDRMDEHWELRGDVECPLLKKKPSDIVREAPIYIGLESEETLLPQAVDYLGNQHFMYASDFPHWDADFPKNIDRVWQHPDLSRETKEKLLYHNAQAFYGLDAPVQVVR
jgi:predicted TIM-barrel fold metal-dependent hydrolase